MSDSSDSRSGGIGFCGLLTIVFIVLKLTHNIDWGWGWVLSPLWIPFGFVCALLLLYAIAMAIVALFQGLAARYQRHQNRRFR